MSKPAASPIDLDHQIADRLETFARFGVDLGLDRILALLDRLNNPHQRVPIVHIAGTNGKGSVCASVAAILEAAGYRVGRYTSPHLVRWAERICLNSEPVTSAILHDAIEHVIAAIHPDDPTPTQFEVFTAAAWVIFAQQAVDLAVIEVGLGGRLDATNVVDQPLVSAIVSIGWDHWQRLGNSLGAIAGEKAGILKPHCPAVVGVLPAEATAVVTERVTELHCPTLWAEPAEWADASATPPLARWRDRAYPLALLGDFQLQNSAIALGIIEQLRSQGWQIPDTAICQGLASVRWAGRMEWKIWNGHRFLLDGAHNREAAIALRQYIDRTCPQQPISWAIAMLAVKDLPGVLAALLRPGDRLFAFAVEGHSSAPPTELMLAARELDPDLVAIAVDDLETALQQAIIQAQTDQGVAVLCGSLYAIGNAYRDLDLQPG